MEVIRTRALRGPNLWSHHTAIEAIVSCTPDELAVDKLAGFDAGADDYLTKPFQPEELLLRLRALIRRSAGHASPRLQCGPLLLDVNAGRFELDGELLHLSPQEQRILSYFLHHPDVVISRSRLGEHVYEAGFDPDSNTLDVLIGRIRRKLGSDLILPHEAVRGIPSVSVPRQPQRPIRGDQA